MLGMGELLVILCLVLVLFGGKKLPEFARNLGEGMREFKRAFYGLEEAQDPLERENLKSLDQQKKDDLQPHE